MNAELVLDAPLAGECVVLNPPGHAPWAFDIVRVDPRSGRPVRGSLLRYLSARLRAADAIGWGDRIFSPVDGQAIAAHDGAPDHSKLVPWWDLPAAFLVRPLRHRGDIPAMAGNHVIIATSTAYVLLAHLGCGSVSVAAGDLIRAGQPVGALGNSGNSVGPHLHMQVMDGPNPLRARVLPFSLRQYGLWDGQRWSRREGARLPLRTSRIRFGSPPGSTAGTDREATGA